jgi:hypothetical protein
MTSERPTICALGSGDTVAFRAMLALFGDAFEDVEDVYGEAAE